MWIEGILHEYSNEYNLSYQDSVITDLFIKMIIPDKKKIVWFLKSNIYIQLLQYLSNWFRINLYSIIYHYKSYTIFRVAEIVLTVTNASNRGTFACRTVTTIENRNMNATFFWNISNIPQIWNIQIYAALERTFGHF